MVNEAGKEIVKEALPLTVLYGGAWLGGAQAFLALWAALPGWRWLVLAGRLPGAAWLMERGYRLFLRQRLTLQRWAIAPSALRSNSQAIATPAPCRLR
jgi:predicted DCC family thiol-disulfide oxidoreductase YuxK